MLEMNSCIYIGEKFSQKKIKVIENSWE